MLCPHTSLHQKPDSSLGFLTPAFAMMAHDADVVILIIIDYDLRWN